MKIFYSLLTILVFSNVLLSQNERILIGDCLDEPELLNVMFIDADSSGIYFLKNGIGQVNYVEKYDSKTLKKVYRCRVPELECDYNYITFSIKYRRFMYILKDGHVDLIAQKTEGKTVELFTFRVDAEGSSDDHFNRISSIQFENKAEGNVYMKLSPQKKYLCLYNTKELKGNVLAINYRVKNTEQLSLVKSFEYALQITPTEASDCLNNVYDDGHIGAFYNQYQPRFVAVDAYKRLSSQSLITLVNNDAIEFNTDALLRSPLIENEAVLMIRNKSTKKYGFLCLQYDTINRAVSVKSLDYVSDDLAERLGKMKGFDRALRENFIYREKIVGDDYTYKIISSHRMYCGQVCIEYQSYMIVLIYNKQGKLIGDRIIPVNITDNSHAPTFRDMYTEYYSKNYGAMLYNDDLYIFINEDKSNREFDLYTGKIAAFERCKDIELSDYCSYKVSPGRSIEKEIVKTNTRGDYVFPILNNYQVSDKHHYVYIQVDDKKMLGKIVSGQ